MEEDKLIKLVCPLYKQYLKSILLCFFIYVIFKIHNGLVIAISIAMMINLLSSMVESTKWYKAICSNEYSLKYAKVTGFIYSCVVTDLVDDYALPFIHNLRVGDEVMLLVFNNDYLVIKKVSDNL